MWSVVCCCACVLVWWYCAATMLQPLIGGGISCRSAWILLYFHLAEGLLLVHFAGVCVHVCVCVCMSLFSVCTFHSMLINRTVVYANKTLRRPRSGNCYSTQLTRTHKTHTQSVLRKKAKQTTHNINGNSRKQKKKKETHPAVFVWCELYNGMRSQWLTSKPSSISVHSVLWYSLWSVRLFVTKKTTLTVKATQKNVEQN